MITQHEFLSQIPFKAPFCVAKKFLYILRFHFHRLVSSEAERKQENWIKLHYGEKFFFRMIFYAAFYEARGKWSWIDSNSYWGMNWSVIFFAFFPSCCREKAFVSWRMKTITRNIKSALQQLPKESLERRYSEDEIQLHAQTQTWAHSTLESSGRKSNQSKYFV